MPMIARPPEGKVISALGHRPDPRRRRQDAPAQGGRPRSPGRPDPDDAGRHRADRQRRRAGRASRRRTPRRRRDNEIDRVISELNAGRPRWRPGGRPGRRRRRQRWKPACASTASRRRGRLPIPSGTGDVHGEPCRVRPVATTTPEDQGARHARPGCRRPSSHLGRRGRRADQPRPDAPPAPATARSASTRCRRSARSARPTARWSPPAPS